jgi:hypothetical protein
MPHDEPKPSTNPNPSLNPDPSAGFEPSAVVLPVPGESSTTVSTPPVARTPAAVDAGNPNAPPSEEVVAAVFPTVEAADRAAEALIASGVQRDYVVELGERLEKRDFLKRFVHRDGDRHTHGGVAAVFTGLLGAVAMSMISVATMSQYMPDGFGPPIAALAGAVLGGGLGAMLGGLAFRTADDSSFEIVESIAAEGYLVAVRRPLGSTHVSLDEVGRVLERHNGRAIRLCYRANQADLHPGDLREQHRQTHLFSPTKSASVPEVAAVTPQTPAPATPPSS